MNLAPIILFVYNRPWHTRQTIEALQKNDLAKESVLYIYLDGSKNKEDDNSVLEVGSYISSITGFKQVNIIKRENNWGLTNNIIDGVTTVIDKYGKIIVLEDDIVTAPGFLKFMNEALDAYEPNTNISQISGYIYPHKTKVTDPAILLRILGCWGWATWKDRWQFYEHNVNKHIEQLNTLKSIKQFNINGHANFYEQLIDNANGTIYTWAVRWYASWFYKNMLSVYPRKSLVVNIGDDESGVHSKKSNSAFRTKPTDYIELSSINQIRENTEVSKAIDLFYKRNFNKKKGKTSFISKLLKSVLFRFVPETRVLFSNDIIWGKLRNTKWNNSLGIQVKINDPYYITESDIGNYTYISLNSHITNTSIGKFCSIGPNLVCGWGVHPTKGISTHPMFYSTAKQNGITLCQKNKIEERKQITIGNDVFIGANVTILDGITIGDGAIIGAGAVVSKNIPPYAIAVGCPIQIKQFRFEEHIVEKLQKIKWWDKDMATLMDIEANFFDIDKFLEKYE